MRKIKGWRGNSLGHKRAALKGWRRRGHGYIDYKPTRSKIARARDRATKSKSQPWERR